jgi:predicted glycosyltransferase
MSLRVLFYVQHLLGIGHLKRAATLVRALGAADMDVTLVSGGEAVPVLDAKGLRIVQLPSVRAADMYFKKLLDQRGEVVDEAWKEDRRRRLLDLYAEVKPDILVIELFPFGRRQMRFELMPLLEAAKADVRRPLIVSSVRDILVAKDKSSRNLEMVQAAETWFDAILVHGDPGLIPFDATFPQAERLAGRLHYTGYVVDQACSAVRDGGPGTGEVVVSTGGGAVSEHLLAAAIGARPLSRLKDRTWRLLVGHNLPEARFQALKGEAPSGIIIERARTDFVRLLANCELSISQGGYNTVMEILATRARGVIVPYAGGEETEQTLRGQLLAQRGLIQVVEERDLTPRTLAAAADRALSQARPDEALVRMDGANASARLLAELAARRMRV